MPTTLKNETVMSTWAANPAYGSVVNDPPHRCPLPSSSLVPLRSRHFW